MDPQTSAPTEICRPSRFHFEDSGEYEARFTEPGRRLISVLNVHGLVVVVFKASARHEEGGNAVAHSRSQLLG